MSKWINAFNLKHVLLLLFAFVGGFTLFQPDPYNKISLVIIGIILHTIYQFLTHKTEDKDDGIKHKLILFIKQIKHNNEKFFGDYEWNETRNPAWQVYKDDIEYDNLQNNLYEELKEYYNGVMNLNTNIKHSRVKLNSLLREEFRTFIKDIGYHDELASGDIQRGFSVYVFGKFDERSVVPVDNLIRFGVDWATYFNQVYKNENPRFEISFYVTESKSATRQTKNCEDCLLEFSNFLDRVNARIMDDPPMHNISNEFNRLKKLGADLEDKLNKTIKNELVQGV